MGKESDLLLSIPFGMQFWVFGEHEPLIIALFLPFVYCINWRGTWAIKGIDWASVTARDIKMECKRQWYHPGTF